MPLRRGFNAALSAATASLLSSCGSILYPDRVHQTERGSLDPAIMVLDGLGLIFFLVPGLIAFAVDFATGAIYIPADKIPGERERTIFDGLSRHTPHTEGRLTQSDIEKAVKEQTGLDIDLLQHGVRAARLDHLSQFRQTYYRLAG
jgi:hypothetical protein